jgi:hypothetical protein
MLIVLAPLVFLVLSAVVLASVREALGARLIDAPPQQLRRAPRATRLSAII